MRRIAMTFVALVLVLMIAGSTTAQPLEPEERLGTLNDSCQQGNLAACVQFGVFIGSHPAQRSELMQAHPEWFWWVNG
jgi:hypothetical protein